MCDVLCVDAPECGKLDVSSPWPGGKVRRQLHDRQLPQSRDMCVYQRHSEPGCLAQHRRMQP
ncbi:hypothetical protein F6B41_34050 [Microbacterium lushaniae]|nr:hypothetical protein F6B41_34050 [Microbacterium lushaniae]